MGIYPRFFLGLGGSGTVAYKFYLSINRQQKKENKKRKIKYRLTDTCNDTETKGRFI